MLDEFDIPTHIEGLICIQLFKASRGYADSAVFNIAASGLDGARLRLGGLPDAYVCLRGTLAAQLEGILSGFRNYDATVEAAIARERREFSMLNRPMALVIGWQESVVGRRTPIGGWDWVDYVGEYRRAAESGEHVHARLDLLATSLAVGLGPLMEDRVATHQFWVAPGMGPVVVFREVVGGAEVSQTSGEATPRSEIQEWVEQVTRLDQKLSEALAEPLRLIAAARATERGWLRFTLGWAALERLATELGARFDAMIIVEQKTCSACGADVTERKPTIRPRLDALVDVLEIPESADLKAELARIHRLRGRSHVGAIPEGGDVVAPEQIATRIVRAVYESPTTLEG